MKYQRALHDAFGSKSVPAKVRRAAMTVMAEADAEIARMAARVTELEQDRDGWIRAHATSYGRIPRTGCAECAAWRKAMETDAQWMLDVAKGLQLQAAAVERHPPFDHNWMTGEPAASPEVISGWVATTLQGPPLEWPEDDKP